MHSDKNAWKWEVKLQKNKIHYYRNMPSTVYKYRIKCLSSLEIVPLLVNFNMSVNLLMSSYSSFHPPLHKKGLIFFILLDVTLAFCRLEGIINLATNSIVPWTIMLKQQQNVKNVKNFNIFVFTL